MPRFQVYLRFDAESLEDAEEYLDGLDDILETWDPPTWIHGKLREVKK